MLWLWILIGVLVLLAIIAILGYNKLVRLRNEVGTGWANIDVQLQRRTDLIPNLVETVRGYAAHERGVFDEVTRARTALQQAGSPASAAVADAGLTNGPILARSPVNITSGKTANGSWRLRIT